MRAHGGYRDPDEPDARPHNSYEMEITTAIFLIVGDIIAMFVGYGIPAITRWWNNFF